MTIDPVSFLNAGGSGRAEKKSAGAAQDFESLLIGQMLKAAREEKSGWLGSDDADQSSDAVLSLGEQQMSKALAAGGGLGLAKMILPHLAPSKD